MWTEFVLLVAAGYLLGAFPLAYLLVKWIFKKDIRRVGSGGTGASNVFNHFSRPLGIAIGIYDAGKGAFMVWMADLAGLDTAFMAVVGAAVVAGHNWPVFLNFNAGRGLSTTLGVVFYLFPFGLIVFVAGAIFTLLVGSSPIPTLIGVAAMSVAAWIRHEPIEIVLSLVGLFLLLIIRRLTAPITDRSRGIGFGALMLNRFLFDRDIRDGREWIGFKSVAMPGGKHKREDR